MKLVVTFIISIILFLGTVFIAICNRRKIEICLRILTIGVVCTVLILVFPLEKDFSKNDVLENNISSGGVSEKNIVITFLTALQTGSLDADYEKLLENAASTQGVFSLYVVLLLTMCMIAPILVGGTILSFFKTAFHKLRYLCLSPVKNVYYFSELNNESYTLAMNLNQREKQSGENFMIVFCNGGNTTEETMIERGYEENFIVISDCEYNCIKKSKRKRYYFEISKDMDLNLNSTKKLITSLNERNSNNKNIKIYLFSNQAEAEIILNSTEKNGLEVVLINEAITISYDLMFNKPLYEAFEISHSKKLSVLIVGMGKIGKEILKSVLWCGQMGEEYSLSVKAIDIKADYIQSVFLKDFPEITSENYDIEFISADVNTFDFERALDKSCQDCNYIVVSMGDDELNIKASLYLRGYYLRKSKNFDNEPIIAAVVMGDVKYDCVKDMLPKNIEQFNLKKLRNPHEKSENYNIYSFGAYRNIYSYESIISSEIEKLALNVHAVYSLAYSNGADSPEDIRRSYFLNEINKRSSRANAIHIKYKLYSLGLVMERKENVSCDKTNCHEIVTEKLTHDNTIKILSKLEHSRWNAFQRSEGYRSISIDQAMKYKTTNMSHRHLRAKLHPCICDWELLDKVTEAFDPNFKKYDYDFIRHIPQIIGVTFDRSINLSGVEYVIYSKEGGMNY